MCLFIICNDLHIVVTKNVIWYRISYRRWCACLMDKPLDLHPWPYFTNMFQYAKLTQE